MDIVKTYNPSNTLSEKDQAAMHDLTPKQIEQLAKAYPNQPRGNAYLVYYMEKESPQEQRFPLGTWHNLHSLRKLGRTDILPHAFSKTFHGPKARIVGKPAPQRVVDLSKKEIDNAEGVKKGFPLDEGEGGIKEVAPASMDAIPQSELDGLKSELKEAIDNKAHHMTIKSLQAKIEAIEGPAESASDGKIDLGSL